MVTQHDVTLPEHEQFSINLDARRQTILRWVDRNSSQLLNGYSYGNETCKRILLNAARLRLRANPLR